MTKDLTCNFVKTELNSYRGTMVPHETKSPSILEGVAAGWGSNIMNQNTLEK